PHVGSIRQRCENTHHKSCTQCQANKVTFYGSTLLLRLNSTAVRCERETGIFPRNYWSGKTLASGTITRASSTTWGWQVKRRTWWVSAKCRTAWKVFRVRCG